MDSIANIDGYGKICFMFRSRQVRFFLGVGLAVILLVVLIVIIFSHSSSNNAPQAAVPKPLAAYATDPSAQVAMLIDGPVNAPSEHNQVQVIVSNSTTTINVFSGYDNLLKSSDNFPMSVSAFHVFLRSLEYAGYNYGSTSSNLSQASGFCPTGDRYIFSFNADNLQLERFWTTSCGGPHTFNGNSSLVLELFENQVPNYADLTSNLNL